MDNADLLKKYYNGGVMDFYDVDVDKITLVKVVLELKKLEYIFNWNQIKDYYYHFFKYLKNNTDDTSPLTDDLKQFIEFIFGSDYHKCIVIHRGLGFYGKITNVAFHYCLDTLFNTNYEFPTLFVSSLITTVDYHNEKFENQNYIDYNLMVYFLLKLGNEDLDNIFYNKMIQSINNNDISLKYVLLVLDVYGKIQNINPESINFFVNVMLNKFINNGGDNDAMCKYIIYRGYLKYQSLTNIIVENTNTTKLFIEMLNNKKILGNRLHLLFHAIKHSYMPTVEIFNNLLLSMEKGRGK